MAENIKKILSLLLSAIFVFCFSSCRGEKIDLKLESRNLMNHISCKEESGKKITDSYKSAMVSSSLQIFKTVTATQNKQGINVAMSPVAIYEQLLMISNGTRGETAEQVQEILLNGISIDNANMFSRTFLGGLKNEKTKVSFANSLWINNSLYSSVKKPFLETNKKYYGFDIYKSDFSGKTLQSDINKWADFQTNGQIKEINTSPKKDEIMYSVSLTSVNGEWAENFDPLDSFIGKFENYNGEIVSSDFMMCRESQYIEDSYATGFIKQYAGKNYSFVALIPNEQISLTDYINMLDGETFLGALESKKDGKAVIKIPEFTTDFEVSMKENLELIGLDKLFSKTESDFTGFMREDEFARISEVYQKTNFKFSEKGTTGAEPDLDAAVEQSSEKIDNYKVITFERPFFYAVIDNNTNLPIITGTVLTL